MITAIPYSGSAFNRRYHKDSMKSLKGNDVGVRRC